MDAVAESWDFTPTREYTKVGVLTTSVARQDNEGWVRDWDEKTVAYVDVVTGIIVGNRQTFEAFIGPLDALVRAAAIREDSGYDS